MLAKVSGWMFIDLILLQLCSCLCPNGNIIIIMFILPHQQAAKGFFWTCVCGCVTFIQAQLPP